MSRSKWITAGALAGIAVMGMVCCRGSLVHPEYIDIGEVEDVLEGPLNLDAVVSTWPQDFLIVRAGDLKAGLEKRTELAAGGDPLVLVVDAQGLAAEEQGGLADTLVEPALDEKGPILIDRSGDLTRSLKGVLEAPVLVRLAEKGEVLARIDLADAESASQLEALGR